MAYATAGVCCLRQKVDIEELTESREYNIRELEQIVNAKREAVSFIQETINRLKKEAGRAVEANKVNTEMAKLFAIALIVSHFV